MPNRAQNWPEQAKRNLERAVASRKEGRHEWVCFAGQQAAELTVKALHVWHGQEAWGHAVARLLEDLPSQAPSDLIANSKALDNVHVPTRYPSGHPEGAPFGHYGIYQSQEAIKHAGEVLACVRARMAGEARG